MPKTNTLGGKKKKRGKNRLHEYRTKKIELATDAQEYGIISNIIGGGKFNVLCYDNKLTTTKRTCLVRGSMRKKIWLNTGDIILIALRDFGKLHDIINKYNTDEIITLKNLNLIPSNTINDDQEVDFIDNRVDNEDNEVKDI